VSRLEIVGNEAALKRHGEGTCEAGLPLPDGRIAVACRHCARAGNATNAAMRETDAFYTDLALVDGKTRKNYATPVFACEACGKTTRPLSTRLLEQLLTGNKKLSCPRCRSTRLAVRKDTPRRGEREAVVHCARCSIEFRFDLNLATAEERYRFFVWRSKPEPSQERPDGDLRSYDDDDTAGEVA
jgi:DNA-directed RNA polymerase subunit RPC12/RpoP